MSSNHMTHKMEDLCTTNCSRRFASPLLRLNLQSAFRQPNHSLPSQNCYNGSSFGTHFECARTCARPRLHSKKMVPLYVAAFFGPAATELPQDPKKDNVGRSIHDALGMDVADVVHVIAMGCDDKEASLAGFDTSDDPISTTHMGTKGLLSLVGCVGKEDRTTSLPSSEIIQGHKQRRMINKTQQLTYLFAALASSVGITSLAGASVYWRFAWQMQGGEVPWTEMCGTFSLALGAAVGMEYWARWAHRTLWHASLWSMHESHHQAREGPFELNDVFAIINAVPAIALMAFGFINKGLVPGLCFGAGLGITIFGIAYMFVHDGLVHRRFPVGPIADVPYFQKVAAAHQLHHADKFNGVPYGLFLGPMELEEVGGRTELEQLLQKRKRERTNPING